MSISISQFSLKLTESTAMQYNEFTFTIAHFFHSHTKHTSFFLNLFIYSSRLDVVGNCKETDNFCMGFFGSEVLWLKGVSSLFIVWTSISESKTLVSVQKLRFFKDFTILKSGLILKIITQWPSPTDNPVPTYSFSSQNVMCVNFLFIHP